MQSNASDNVVKNMQFTNVSGALQQQQQQIPLQVQLHQHQQQQQIPHQVQLQQQQQPHPPQPQFPGYRARYLGPAQPAVQPPVRMVQHAQQRTAIQNPDGMQPNADGSVVKYVQLGNVQFVNVSRQAVQQPQQQQVMMVSSPQAFQQQQQQQQQIAHQMHPAQVHQQHQQHVVVQQQQQTAPVSLSTCHPADDDIAYETEHTFIENGKEVRKMLVRVRNETIWVDCVPSESLAELQNDALVLHLDEDADAAQLLADQHGADGIGNDQASDDARAVASAAKRKSSETLNSGASLLSTSSSSSSSPSSSRVRRDKPDILSRDHSGVVTSVSDAHGVDSFSVLTDVALSDIHGLHHHHHNHHQILQHHQGHHIVKTVVSGDSLEAQLAALEGTDVIIDANGGIILSKDGQITIGDREELDIDPSVVVGIKNEDDDAAAMTIVESSSAPSLPESSPSHAQVVEVVPDQQQVLYSVTGEDGKTQQYVWLLPKDVDQYVLIQTLVKLVSSNPSLRGGKKMIVVDEPRGAVPTSRLPSPGAGASSAPWSYCSLCSGIFESKGDLVSHILHGHHDLDSQLYVTIDDNGQTVIIVNTDQILTTDNDDDDKAMLQNIQEQLQLQQEFQQQQLDSTSTGLKSHIMLAHNVSQANIIMKTSSDIIQTTNQLHEVCETCGKVFFSKDLLEDHANAVHKNDRKFKCDKCKFMTDGIREWNQHYLDCTIMPK